MTLDDGFPAALEDYLWHMFGISEWVLATFPDDPIEGATEQMTWSGDMLSERSTLGIAPVFPTTTQWILLAPGQEGEEEDA